MFAATFCALCLTVAAQPASVQTQAVVEPAITIETPRSGTDVDAELADPAENHPTKNNARQTFRERIEQRRTERAAGAHHEGIFQRLRNKLKSLREEHSENDDHGETCSQKADEVSC